MKSNSFYAGVFAAGLSAFALNGSGQPGSLDTSFDVGTGTILYIRDVTAQADGKVLVAGRFTSINGFLRSSVARLNTNGTLDMTFVSPLLSTAPSDISWTAIQPDGKILIAGFLEGPPNNYIARLNNEGSFDNGFNPLSAPSFRSLTSQALLPDGRILVGGLSPEGIVRLNSDGSLDPLFDPGTGLANSLDSVVTVATQPDGKILIAGEFQMFNRTPRIRVARLNTDGSLDNSFDPGSGPNAEVQLVWVQPDGKIVIWGYFTIVRDIPQAGLARLNSDGTLDTSFNPGYRDSVNDLAIQPDGKIVVAGANGKIVRLNSDWTLDSSFDAGSGADAAIYSLYLQSDGQILIGGAFTHVNGVSRNHVARLNGDGRVPPHIVGQPMSQTAGIGDTVSFSVVTSVPGWTSYQWFYAGTNIIVGATNRFLTLTNVQTWQSGSYSVVVSNAAGAVTSQPGALSVLPTLGIDAVPALTLIGDVGTAYRIEYVDAVGNTNAWHLLAPLTLTNRPQIYVDLTAIRQPKRFYRLVQLP